MMKQKPRDFLRLVGWVLVVLAVFGYASGSLFSPTWSLDSSENVAHLIVGVVLLAASYWAKDNNLIKWLTVLVGLSGLFFAYYGWFIDPNFRGLANLDTVDNLVHVVVGIWALAIVWGKKK